MAIKIKNKAWTPSSLVESLFPAEQVAGGLLNDAYGLENAGAKLVIGTNHMTITNNGHVLETVSVSVDAVSLCMQGKVGGAARTAIRDKIVDLITGAKHKVEAKEFEDVTKAMKKPVYLNPENQDVKAEIMSVYVHGSPSPYMSKSLPGPHKVAAIKRLRELCGLGLKEAKELLEHWIDTSPEVPEDPAIFGANHPSEWIKSNMDFTTLEDNVKKSFKFDLATAKDKQAQYAVLHGQTDTTTLTSAVDLKDATALHQPVYGTSVGSRYHVIALGAGVKIAARIKNNNQVSIRAVAGTKKVGQALVAAGFDKKLDGGHYSTHLDPDTRVMAKKCIGATLFATGLQLNVSTEIDAIAGAGK